MNPAAKAAELDRVAGIVQRLGLRPCAWSDDVVHVEEVYAEAPLFVVYPNDGLGGETRCSADDVAAVVARIRSRVGARKGAV